MESKIFEKFEASETNDSIHAIVGLNFNSYKISNVCVWVDFEFAEDAKALYQNLNHSGIHDELEVYCGRSNLFTLLVDNHKTNSLLMSHKMHCKIQYRMPYVVLFSLERRL